MELNILLSRWLSRCIVRATEEKIKLKFRQLEKYKLKNLKAKSHLVLNETCLSNNLLPGYTGHSYKISLTIQIKLTKTNCTAINNSDSTFLNKRK